MTTSSFQMPLLSNDGDDFCLVEHHDDEHECYDDDESDEDWEPILDRADSSSDSSDSSDTDSDESDELSSIDSEPPLFDETSCYHYPTTTSLKSPTQTTTTSRTTRRKRHILLAIPLLLMALLALAVFTTAFYFPSTIHFDDGLESLYIPGLGFSGFWFALGRLKSIPDKASKHYVCFSAGCLGSVAILNDFSVQEMGCMAETAQEQWRRGEIDRYQVVSQFVDSLVYRQHATCLTNDDDRNTTSPIPILADPSLLSKLHILTTEVNHNDRWSRLGMQATMRSPSSLEELRDMLVQTAWIPFATGNGLHYNGHLDGGLTFWQHPRCDKSVNLPMDFGLIFNSLNVNMPIEKAYQLWNQGLDYGL